MKLNQCAAFAICLFKHSIEVGSFLFCSLIDSSISSAY
uniref:Uncharacterized protein n=1 Tax=Arundo donax TaxID=35708 RepID=A0A0A8ZE18_ARUDO